jgi:hypothetical protein
VLLKLTLNWLIPLKEVYNNRDSFPSLEHYTQQLHTNTKNTTVTKQYLRGTPAQIIQKT